MTVLLEPTGLAVQGLNEQPTTIMLAVAVGAPGADGPPGSGVLPTGGTTGQHLAKASDADQDAEWVDPATGGSQLDAQVVLYCGTLTGDGLTPAEGDLMSRVFHVGGSAVDDATGLVGWSSLETYEWHAEDERFIGSHVLIIPSDAEQWFGRTVPTVYAEVTEDGFEAIEVAGTTQVNLMCAVGELGQPAPMFGVNGGNEASGGATIPTLAATHFAWPYMTTDEVLTPEGQSVTDWLIAHDNTTGFYLIDLIATTITGTTISVLAKDNSTTDIDVTDKSPGQVVLNLTTGNLLTTTETTFENERNATDGIYITRGAEVDGARGVLVAMFEGAHELFDQDDEGGGDPADQRVHVYDLAATYEGPSYPTGFGDTFGPFTTDQRVVFYDTDHPGGHLYRVSDDTLVPDGFEFNADTFGHLVSIEKDTDRSDHRSLLKVGIVDPDADPLVYSLFVPNPVTGGGGAVDSVNGQTGTVVLDAADVGAATQGDIDSAVGGLGSAAQADVGDFASASQGVKADEAFPLSSLANNEDIATIEGGFAAGISRAGLAADPAFTGAFASAAQGGTADSALQPGDPLPAADLTGTIDDARIPPGVARDSEVTSAISALATVYQPLDSDLSAIAALSTTSYGRALLALADAAAGRTALGLGTAATTASTAYDAAGTAAAAQAASQPLDSDLTAIAALTTTSFGRALLTMADASATRTALGLGTAATTAASAYDVAGAAAAAQAASQPLDSDLTTIAGLSATTNNFLTAVAGAWASRTPAQAMATLSGAAAADFDLNSHKITGQADPTNPQDSATKAYVDAGRAKVIRRNSAQAAVTLSTSGQSLFTVASPPTITGTTDDVFLITAAIRWLQNAGATRTGTVFLKVGATTVLTMLTAGIADSATAHRGLLTALVTVDGSSAFSAGGTWAPGIPAVSAGDYGTGTDNISGGVTVDILGSCSVVSGTEEMTLQSLSIVRIRP